MPTIVSIDSIYSKQRIYGAALTIVANVAIATGPARLEAPRSSAIKPNLSYCI